MRTSASQQLQDSGKSAAFQGIFSCKTTYPKYVNEIGAIDQGALIYDWVCFRSQIGGFIAWNNEKVHRICLGT